MDILPFIGDGGRCVSRNDYQDFVYKGAQNTIDFFNWLTDETESMVKGTSKEITSMKDRQRRRLLNDFKYLYDEVIFLGITRYEFGLWLLFVIAFSMRKAL